MIAEDEKKEEKSKKDDNILEMLNKALADEWLAAYQYWVCLHLVRGEGRSDVMPEFEQHYKDEMEHVEKLMLRIKELGGTPITSPSSWIEMANPWTEVKTTEAEEQLDITIKAEADAIAYYEEIIKACKNVDEVTMRLCRSILSDESEHLYDLQMLKEEIND
jgi:bacterioferritin